MAGYGAGFYDFDDDGWKDLFVTRAHVESMPVPGAEIDELQHCLPQPWQEWEVEGLDCEAGLEATPAAVTVVAPSET
jgi:hypothetical protein